jgi:Fe-S-cluster containining protein
MGKEITSEDCISCGACCAYKWSWPVLKRDRSDCEKIPQEMQRMDYPLMKTKDNRCVALEGVVGSCVSCKIYFDRPYACRQFTPNGELCLEARKKLNIN